MQRVSPTKGALSRALDEFPKSLTSLLDSSDPETGEPWGKAEYRELLSLNKEGDPEILGESLVQFAARLETKNKDDLAARIYRFLEDPCFAAYPKVTAVARKRLQALVGAGTVGGRVEVLFRRFAEEALAPGAVFAMGVAGFAYKATRLATLSRLASTPTAGFWTRGVGARVVSALSGFGVEGIVFPLAGRVAAEAMGRGRPWTATALGEEALSSYIVLGALKLSGAASAEASLKFLSRSRTGINSSIQQVAMLGGITLGHRLEEAAGLRQPMPGANALVDSLATLLHFNAAGRLTRSAWGEGFQRWERRVDLRSRDLESGLPVGATPSPASPGRKAEPGPTPERTSWRMAIFGYLMHSAAGNTASGIGASWGDGRGLRGWAHLGEQYWRGEKIRERSGDGVGETLQRAFRADGPARASNAIMEWIRFAHEQAHSASPNSRIGGMGSQLLGVERLAQVVAEGRCALKDREAAALHLHQIAAATGHGAVYIMSPGSPVTKLLSAMKFSETERVRISVERIQIEGHWASIGGAEPSESSVAELFALLRSSDLEVRQSVLGAIGGLGSQHRLHSKIRETMDRYRDHPEYRGYFPAAMDTSKISPSVFGRIEHALSEAKQVPEPTFNVEHPFVGDLFSIVTNYHNYNHADRLAAALTLERLAANTGHGLGIFCNDNAVTRILAKPGISWAERADHFLHQLLIGERLRPGSGETSQYFVSMLAALARDDAAPSTGMEREDAAYIAGIHRALQVLESIPLASPHLDGVRQQIATMKQANGEGWDAMRSRPPASEWGSQALIDRAWKEVKEAHPNSYLQSIQDLINLAVSVDATGEARVSAMVTLRQIASDIGHVQALQFFNLPAAREWMNACEVSSDSSAEMRIRALRDRVLIETRQGLIGNDTEINHAESVLEGLGLLRTMLRSGDNSQEIARVFEELGSLEWLSPEAIAEINAIRFDSRFRHLFGEAALTEAKIDDSSAAAIPIDAELQRALGQLRGMSTAKEVLKARDEMMAHFSQPKYQDQIQTQVERRLGELQRGPYLRAMSGRLVDAAKRNDLSMIIAELDAIQVPSELLKLQRLIVAYHPDRNPAEGHIFQRVSDAIQARDKVLEVELRPKVKWNGEFLTADSIDNRRSFYLHLPGGRSLRLVEEAGSWTLFADESLLAAQVDGRKVGDKGTVLGHGSRVKVAGYYRDQTYVAMIHGNRLHLISEEEAYTRNGEMWSPEWKTPNSRLFQARTGADESLRDVILKADRLRADVLDGLYVWFHDKRVLQDGEVFQWEGKRIGVHISRDGKRLYLEYLGIDDSASRKGNAPGPESPKVRLPDGAEFAKFNQVRFRLDASSNRWSIEGGGSLGLRLNGTPVEGEASLRPGDILLLDGKTLQVELGSDESGEMDLIPAYRPGSSEYNVACFMANFVRKARSYGAQDWATHQVQARKLFEQVLEESSMDYQKLGQNLPELRSFATLSELLTHLNVHDREEAKRQTEKEQRLLYPAIFRLLLSHLQRRPTLAP